MEWNRCWAIVFSTGSADQTTTKLLSKWERMEVRVELVKRKQKQKNEVRPDAVL